MNWNLEYLPEAVEDMERLDKSQRVLVQKMMGKTRTNPLPQMEGGYGKPLGNQGGYDLTGLSKIKLKRAGIRVIYFPYTRGVSSTKITRTLHKVRGWTDEAAQNALRIPTDKETENDG